MVRTVIKAMGRGRVRRSLAGCALLALSACGRNGPLYIPAATPAKPGVERGSAVAQPLPKKNTP
ncbi:MAG: LPS translocon maturation chaperone LptM [Acidiferrobacteraceae bacterium]